MKEVEDYLYEADCALSDDAALAAAHLKYPDALVLYSLIKQAQQAVRRVYIWLEANTSRQCP